MRVAIIITALFIGFGAFLTQTQANHHGPFKELSNLQTLSMESKQKQLPIMLMFGAKWCEW